MIVELDERELLDLQLVLDAYLIDYGEEIQAEAKERYQALFDKIEKVCFPDS